MRKSFLYRHWNYGSGEGYHDRRFKEALKLCDNVYIYDNTVSLTSIAVFVDGKLEAKSEKECVWFENAMMETKELENEPHNNGGVP